MSESQKKTNEIIKAPQANVPAQAVTPMQMLQIAIERGADMEQLDKLMTLQERWEANQARKAFVEALAAFKADPPKVTKNRHVKFAQTEYDHATLDHICDVVGAALAKHGLSHTWQVQQHESAAIEVTCVLTHVLGHSERVTMKSMPDGSGSKNPIQQVGSTTTYLQRYTLLAATGLAASDQDNDGATQGEPISAEQKDELVNLIKQTKTDTKTFCNYLQIAAIDDLPAKRFHEAKGALDLKLSKMKEQENDG